MQGSKQGAAKVISYCRNIVEMEKKKHDDIHYTFTRLTKLKRRELVVPFYPVLLFILAMKFLLGIFIGFFNYKR